MKVGNLDFVSCCGMFHVVMGPNPCSCMGAAICMYGCCGGMLIGIAAAMDSGIIQTIIWTLISLNTLVFLWLCLSSPGIPPQIMQAAKGHGQVRAAEPIEGDDLLPTSTEVNRICQDCEEKFQIDKAFVWTKVKTEHCEDCGVCILKIDHHCGFFDRCIG